MAEFYGSILTLSIPLHVSLHLLPLSVVCCTVAYRGLQRDRTTPLLLPQLQAGLRHPGLPHNGRKPMPVHDMRTTGSLPAPALNQTGCLRGNTVGSRTRSYRLGKPGMEGASLGLWTIKGSC
jgi:hypothetical protein